MKCLQQVEDNKCICMHEVNNALVPKDILFQIIVMQPESKLIIIFAQKGYKKEKDLKKKNHKRRMSITTLQLTDTHISNQK